MDVHGPTIYAIVIVHNYPATIRLQRTIHKTCVVQKF